MKQKTALHEFLDQIILKQVEGSVYIIPAITDIQINEALAKERRQIEDAHAHGIKFMTSNSSIPQDVSKQWFDKTFEQ